MSLANYPDTTESGIGWLGRIPLHWRVVRLRHVAELNPSKAEVSDLDRELPVSFLPMEAVGDDGTIQLEHTRSIGTVENGYTYFREGDVTLAKITPCFENGKGAIMRGLLNGIGFGTTELIVVRPRTEHTTSDYLNWLFMSSYFRRFGESTMYGAGGQKRVPDAFVRNFATAIPSLDEQKAISSFLDAETSKIDALVSEQRRLIGLLKEKRQAVISHAVTKGLNPNAPMKPSGIQWLGDVPEHWRIGKCGYYVSVLSGYAFPSSGFSEDENNVRLLRGINVGVSEVRWDETVYWQRQDGDELDRFELLAGDLVIGMDRPWISSGVRVAKINENDLPCFLLQRVAAISTDARLHTDYLWHLLSSKMFVGYVEPETTGVSVPHISPTQIEDFTIPVPPIEEQNKIVDFNASETRLMDTLLAEAEGAIKLLQERRTPSSPQPSPARSTFENLLIRRPSHETTSQDDSDFPSIR